MNYAELSFKKISVIAFIAIAIFASVIGTTVVAERVFGVPSIAVIGTSIASAVTAWQYRIEFNWKAGLGALNPRSLLATIGFALSPGSPGAAAGSEQSLPVLLYHGIVPKVIGAEDVSADAFKDQMFALKAAGWQTVTIDQVLQYVREGKPLPPKSFLLTFDDARKDSYYPVDPILQALGYHAVMFTITGHSLNPRDPASSYYLTPEELIIMAASGRWDIESHSDIGHDSYPIDAKGDTGHFYSNRLWIPTQEPGEDPDAYAARVHAALAEDFSFHDAWDLSSSRLETTDEFTARVEGDLANAKQLLEDKLGVTVEGFAYPFNDFAQSGASNFAQGSTILLNAANNTYPMSFYQWSPTDGYSQNLQGEGQLVRRIEVTDGMDTNELLETLAGGEPKQLPFTSAESDTAGWLRIWGNVKTGNGALSVEAGTSTTGAVALLDGTSLWSNYTFSATVNWIKAQDVSVIGNFQKSVFGEQSYLECLYENGSAKLRDHEGDKVTILASAKNSAIAPGNGRQMGIVIVKGYAECAWSGGIILGAKVPASASTAGGPAIEVWSPAVSNAGITVTNISVEAKLQ